MPAHFNDNGTWRTLAGISFNDNGTWRTIQEAWFNDNGTWRKFHNAFTVPNPIVIGTYYFSNGQGFGDGANADVSLTVYTTGAWAIQSNYYPDGSGSNDGGNWGTPAAGGAGDGYWVRFTRTSDGGNSGSSTPTTGWLQLNADRTVVAACFVAPMGGGRNRTAYYTIDIATDAAGSNIVATKTGIQLDATCSD